MLVVQTEEAEETTARLIDTSHLVLIGAVDVTAPVLHELMRRDIPVSWYSGSGWFLGHTIGTGHRNVELRTAQYRRASTLSSACAWRVDWSPQSSATAEPCYAGTRATTHLRTRLWADFGALPER